ncbi:RDD family protein [Flavobacterium sp.]|jgi:hypothetical protein|uniref:RDD family protein n=1 Tax=Flavobacterium sp. TaxID=239 RepID=UPI0037BEF576
MGKVLMLRIGALVVDYIIYSIFISLFFSLTKLEKRISLGSDFLGDLEINYSLEITHFTFLAYFLVFDFFFNGTTIGKKVLNIIVVNKNDFKFLSLSNRIKRTLLKFISVLIFPITIILYLINNDLILQDKYSKGITIIKEKIKLI